MCADTSFPPGILFTWIRVEGSGYLSRSTERNTLLYFSTKAVGVHRVTDYSDQTKTQSLYNRDKHMNRHTHTHTDIMTTALWTASWKIYHVEKKERDPTMSLL